MSGAPHHHPEDLIPPWQAYAELGRIPLHALPLGEVLQRVAELGRRSLPGADEVSVTLVDGAQGSTVAFTGDLASHLDERQYAEPFGPGLEAARAGASVVINDLERHDGYPSFVAVARRVGVTASMSVGMHLPDRVLGVLNAYNTTGGRFTDEAVRTAEGFVGHAAVVLANARALSAETRLAEQLQEAMRTRAPIEHAIGVLIGAHGITPDEAFRLLKERSQSTNRKLRDVAGDIVRRAQQRRSPAATGSSRSVPRGGAARPADDRRDRWAPS